MKKTVLFLVCAVLFFVPSAYAGDSGFYIGIGGSYALENFGIESDEATEELGVEVDYKNTWGMNFKVGYNLNKLFAVEFNFDYLPGFEWEGKGSYQDGNYYYTFTYDSKMKLMNYVLAGKLSPDFGAQKVKPFITAGVGYLDGDIDATAMVSIPMYDVSASESTSSSESDLCFKFGLGMDYYLNDQVALDFEGSYVLGIDDMDGVDYFNITLGIAYHF